MTKDRARRVLAAHPLYAEVKAALEARKARYEKRRAARQAA